MFADEYIPVIVFKVFIIIHFIRNDIRQQFRDNQMAADGVIQIYLVQKFLQLTGRSRSFKIIFIKFLIFVQIK